MCWKQIINGVLVPASVTFGAFLVQPLFPLGSWQWGGCLLLGLGGLVCINWKSLAPSSQAEAPVEPTVITWDEINSNSYTCPDVACLLYGYAPSAAAKTLPEVKAWMERLSEQMNFKLGLPIDNATR